MKKSVKVSVVIPVYNVEAYIQECVESVMNQTLKEIEIICVNDGTPDGSMEIVKKLAEKDERIVIVNKKNGGLSSARNAGIKQSTGTFVYFLDSDDYLLPETLEELYSCCQKHQLDHIYFDAKSFFETEEIYEKQKNYETYYQRNGSYDSVYTGMELFVEMRKNWDFKPSACLQMVKKSLLIEKNIWFYEGILHEDNLFSLQVLAETKRVKHINKAYYMRRVHDNSIMTNAKGIRNAYGYHICIYEILKDLEQKKMPEIFRKNLLEYLEGLQKNILNALAHISQEEIVEELQNIGDSEMIRFLLWAYGEKERQNQVRNQKQQEVVSVKRETEALKNTIKKLEQKITEREMEIQEYQTCESYRVGKFVTYLPRKIYGIANLIKEKGFHYFLYRLSLKLTPKKVRVSIIMPVYNASKYLRPCLDTILNQTLKQIEVICVNDGSSDNSLEILEECRKRDSRVVILNQPNQGAGPARNLGLSHAKGEYLLFLDADDLFSPELCNTVYYKCKTEKAEVCWYPAERVDMKTGKLEPMGWVFRESEIPDGIFSASDIKDKIFQLTTGCPWSKMFQKKFVLKHGLQFQNLKNANDVLFVRTACALAERITSVKGQPFVTYRFNDGENTQSQKKKAPLEFYKAFKELKKQLQKHGKFQMVEQSYVNMVLTESLFNLRTAGTEEATNQVRDVLLKEGFKFFEIDKFGEEYFYNKNTYGEYKKLLETVRK